MEALLLEMRALLPKLKALQGGEEEARHEEARNRARMMELQADMEQRASIRSQRELAQHIIKSSGPAGITRDEIFASGRSRFPSVDAVSQLLSRYPEFVQLGDGKWGVQG